MDYAKEDIQTLEGAGITLDDIVAETAAMIRHSNDLTHETIAEPLTKDEEAFLQRGGAVGINEYNRADVRRSIITIASEFVEMLGHAYSQKEVANLLNVTVGRVRQRLDARSLYSITGRHGRVCPRWQFFEGSPLPGLESILKAMSVDAHPVAIQHFFLDVSQDLVSPTLNCILSPRDWLIMGHQLDDVILLAKEL